MPARYKFLTIGSLVGLALGFSLGLVVYHGGNPAIDRFMQTLGPIESVWIEILRVIVLPLIVSYMVLAVTAAVETRMTGRVGGIAIGAHVLLLVATMLFTVTVGPAILATAPLSSDSIQAFQESAADTESAARPDGVDGMVPGEASDASDTASLPTRVYDAFLSVDIVMVLIVTVLFSIVLARIPVRHRDPILSFFRIVSRVSLWSIDALLLAMPFVIVVVTYNVTVKIGGQFAGTIAFWLVLLSGLLFLATLGLYVVARWPGGVPFRRFARAMLPVQALGVASRSSIVCLPKLLEAARNDLGQSEEVAGIVLPLSVSTFKLNRMVSTPMNLFFLAYLYGIDLDPAITASLIFTAMIVSFATPGIPSGGKFTTLPIYLAAGIPVEGVVLLKAVDAIPDIFKTLINVTEDLTISCVVSRFVTRVRENSRATDVARTNVPAAQAIRDN